MVNTRKKRVMSMKSPYYENFCRILEHELIPALGCTEPIAIAYAAAKARSVLGRMPEKIEIKCSGNIIKNVKGVTVPNSGGLVGIEAAASSAFSAATRTQSWRFWAMSAKRTSPFAES